MITFEEWDDFEETTAEFAPSQYEQKLQKSVSELNRDIAREVSLELELMAIRADAEKNLLPQFFFEAGPMTRHPVTMPPESYMEL